MSDDETNDRGELGDAWPVLDAAVEYETGWYDGGYDLVEQPDGSRKRYYWADLPPAVVVVAIVDAPTLAGVDDEHGVDDEQGAVPTDGGERVLFVEQYRPTIREAHLELPAGIVEPGESYTQAGARELEEETGFVPTTVSLVQEYAVATGVLRHRRAVVFADGLEPGERRLDSNEFLTVRSISVDEALERVRESPANDASISGLLLARADGLL